MMRLFSLIVASVPFLVGAWLTIVGVVGHGSADNTHLHQRTLLAAELGILDSAAWRRAALVQSRAVGKETGGGEMQAERSRLSRLLLHALTLAPLQPRLWLLLEERDGADLPVARRAMLLEMAYFTGPGRSDSVAERLGDATQLPGIGSRTLQDLALADVDYLLASTDGQRKLQAIYGRTPDGNLPFLRDAIATRNPIFAQSLSRPAPGR